MAESSTKIEMCSLLLISDWERRTRAGGVSNEKIIISKTKWQKAGFVLISIFVCGARVQ